LVAGSMSFVVDRLARRIQAGFPVHPLAANVLTTAHDRRVFGMR
jgi:hypothetical protein